ncbi:MAG: glycosyltransferase [Patescibacteria group bacterium]
MKIGIDISQLAFERTGVANFLTKFVEALARVDRANEYILFYSSLRRPVPRLNIKNPNFKIKAYKFPPTFLERLWNKFHRFPIENFIGDIDVFITSDWVEPPVKKAKKATILYDLISYKYPAETHPRIVEVQKRKMSWSKKETDLFLAISESAKSDAIEILGIEKEKIKVIYPGV